MRSTSSLLVAVSMLAVGGCASESPLTLRLAECELIGEGEVGGRVTSAFYAPDDCYQHCLADASCEELDAALCRASIELLQRCDQQCAERCSDGTLIAVEALCNGIENCPGGSDEAGCPTFTCDGIAFPARVRCDGVQACREGEDELDCGDALATFRCDDGSMVIHARTRSPRCDGFWNCRDGSDEDDCADLEPMCAP